MHTYYLFRFCIVSWIAQKIRDFNNAKWIVEIELQIDLLNKLLIVHYLET